MRSPPRQSLPGGEFTFTCECGTGYAKPIAWVPRFRGGGAAMGVVCLVLVLATFVSIATGSAAAANYTQETLDR